MNVPIITNDLALQVERSKGDHIESWVRGMQKYAGNPFGCAVLQMKQVRVFAARRLQEIGLFNVVIGLGPQDKELLPEIVRFYRDHEIRNYRLEINPYRVTSDFLAALTAQGFVVSSFQTYLYGVPTLNPPGMTLPSMTIRDVTPSDLDLFADLHVNGFQEALSSVPEQTRSLYRESTKVLYRLPGWHLYLLFTKNIPAGMGMLYMQDGMALLAGGATLPQMRRQGGQTALLRHRLISATQGQCTFISAQTHVGSSSQQNMERLGLKIAYTGTAWIRQERV
jgi:hypothetical protein